MQKGCKQKISSSRNISSISSQINEADVDGKVEKSDLNVHMIVRISLKMAMLKVTNINGRV